TSSQWTRGGGVDEIILLKNGRPIHVISSNYIKNYKLIEKHLGHRLNHLGYEKLKYFKYLKELLMQ
ncbi:hypothetical protein, partial [Xanthovirga aplysinae]|uniref:hypothetical protein n=1 Tax=Xanthovirga aplysinae TaxID=2529853 RepID=UPI001CA44D7C